jgi:glycosyltransferase involved in cell wall biosynthesis
MFDFLSFVERKNPAAVLEAFRRLTRLRPGADVRLVIKLNNAGKGRRDARDFAGELAHASDRVIVIDRVMTDNEVKNLIRGCDCFLSLHRSEGFGFPLGEAMYFGKPVIATGYSGNLEFMNETNACLVPFRLVPVRPGSYPRTDRQVWADPDVDAAVRGMVRIIDDPAYGRTLGESASRHLRTHFSYLAAGLRYRARLAEVLPT